MKDRRGSGGGNGGHPMSGCIAAGLTPRHWTSESVSNKSSASTRDGLLGSLSA